MVASLDMCNDVVEDPGGGSGVTTLICDVVLQVHRPFFLALSQLTCPLTAIPWVSNSIEETFDEIRD
jgi:hypothetical protein